MLKIIRTNSNNPDFIKLVKSLDNYLKTNDGDEHSFYNQFNNIDVLKHVVIAYNNDNIAIACGAFKAFDTTSVEIKRMFTTPIARGKGIAGKILNALESWALELDYKNAILETGKRQIEAVQFYKKCGYSVIPNYGQYAELKNSVCYKKELKTI